jgi:predicted MFS family arabinose efflux permease
MGWVSEQFGTRATFALAGVCTAIAAASVYLYVPRAATEEEKTVVAEAQSSSTIARPR